MEYSKELLIKMYEKMVEIRLCEESFVEPILRREILCPVHLYTGEEAVAVGICANLEKKDKIFGSHRSHGHYLAKGGDLRELMAEVYCKETGCARGRGGSMHIISPENGMLGSAPIVGGTISLALGASLACSLKKDQSVAVSFFGDGASGEGVLWECVNFASLKKLPMIFVCENNFYSTHMPIDEIRSNRNIYEAAKAFDIFSKQIDGNNLLEVYNTARIAVDICRRGEGPCFIEARTYRMRGHVGPDDNVQGTHTDIRPKKEVEIWAMRDPIANYEEYLLSNLVSDLEELQSIKSDIRNKIDAIHNDLRSVNKPSGKEELLKYVFKD